MSLLEVASRVVTKGPFSFLDATLTVELCDPQKKTIRLAGVTSETPAMLLKLLFENTRETGGGPIKEVVMDEKQECAHAFITFEDEEGKS